MINIRLNGVPPSVNKAYTTGFKRTARGKLISVRTLSKEGARYKKEVTAQIVRQFSGAILTIIPNRKYGLAILVSLPEVENKGWPKKTTTRYKRIDTGNRLKLLEDALADATAVDDSNNFIVMISKCQGQEKVTIWLWDIEEEGIPSAVVNTFIARAIQ
jgi:Holliday junction resolvase RusA-like endonuclease